MRLPSRAGDCAIGSGHYQGRPGRFPRWYFRPSAPRGFHGHEGGDLSRQVFDGGVFGLAGPRAAKLEVVDVVQVAQEAAQH